MTFRPELTDTSSEHMHQAFFVEWIRQNHKEVFVFAIPNGGGRSQADGMALKMEGVVKGVSDLEIRWLDGSKRTLFLEMKKVKGGTISPDQFKFMSMMTDAGFPCIVGFGFEDAKAKFLEFTNVPA